MSRIRLVAGGLVLALTTPGLAAAQGRRDGDPPTRRGYQEQDRLTATTFTATTDAGGNAVFTAKGGDFSFEKVVSPTGEATLRLAQEKDVVTIAINRSGLVVGRGRRTVRIDPRTDKSEDIDSVRALLLGSRAVRSFKRLAAALENRDESEEDGALAIVALIDGAIVQLLDGDADAPRRIGQRVTRKHRAALRPVAARRAPDVFRDCVGLYEVALMDSSRQYGECWIEANDAAWWSRSLLFRYCEWEWALRSQQYVWQFIGCFMLPF